MKNLPTVLTPQHRIRTRVLIVESPKLLPLSHCALLKVRLQIILRRANKHTGSRCARNYVITRATGGSMRVICRGSWQRHRGGSRTHAMCSSIRQPPHPVRHEPHSPATGRVLFDDFRRQFLYRSRCAVLLTHATRLRYFLS